ncbi:unnamed protein product [Dibothriocephalus latus]|uniref:Reverse transcriptase domain-containing protein n=1 Tax=Dibothriocephalus latus TaxID=60516 RepID=A0A3P6T995_DIBLA|nr:unnamed protein product [Dibothriocephalus latus]
MGSFNTNVTPEEPMPMSDGVNTPLPPRTAYFHFKDDQGWTNLYAKMVSIWWTLSYWCQRQPPEGCYILLVPVYGTSDKQQEVIQRPKFWARYVDDTFVVIERDQVLTFNKCLKCVFPGIQFTMEEEENNQLASLDILVCRKY